MPLCINCGYDVDGIGLNTIVNCVNTFAGAKIPRANPVEPWHHRCTTYTDELNKLGDVDFFVLVRNYWTLARYLRCGHLVFRRGDFRLKYLVHETLHSRSALSVASAQWRNHDKWVYEGLTEFMTGCILYRYFHRCYDRWRRDISTCPYSYQEETRTWLGIACNIGLDILKKSYFCGLAISVDVSLKEILDAIRRVAVKPVENIFQMSLEQAVQVLREVLGARFEIRYRHTTLDYSELL